MSSFFHSSAVHSREIIPLERWRVFYLFILASLPPIFLFPFLPRLWTFRFLSRTSGVNFTGIHVFAVRGDQDNHTSIQVTSPYPVFSYFPWPIQRLYFVVLSLENSRFFEAKVNKTEPKRWNTPMVVLLQWTEDIYRCGAFSIWPCFQNIFLRYTKSNRRKSIHRLGINSSSGGSRIITDNFEIRVLYFGIRVIPYNDNLFVCALYMIIVPKFISIFTSFSRSQW